MGPVAPSEKALAVARDLSSTKQRNSYSFVSFKTAGGSHASKPLVTALLSVKDNYLLGDGSNGDRSGHHDAVAVSQQEAEKASRKKPSWPRDNKNRSGRSQLSTFSSASSTSEDVAAVAASYYNEPMNIRYHHQVWGDQVHLGRYDLFNEEDATLEGLALMNRAAALTNEVLMSKLFPDAHCVNDETTVMEMGAGYGEFARALVKKHGCKVVCIDMCSEHNAINATRTAQEGLQDKIIIPGERSYFETGMPSASMDFVTGTDSYLHANGDTERVMKEAARVLKRGNLMIFSDLMQADTADITVMEKVYLNLGVGKFCSPWAFEKSGKQHGMELLDFEDYSANIPIHYENLLKMIASLRENAKDVDGSVLDAREARCLAFADATERGALTWGSFVFRRDVE